MITTLAIAACTGQASTIDLSDQQRQEIVANAVNNTGWLDVDDDVWVQLVIDACQAAAWDHEANAVLTASFIDEQGLTGREYEDQIPLIIWLGLNTACRDKRPEGATRPPGSP